MISEKISTNPESFKKFGRGRRIDLANSDGMTLLFLTPTTTVILMIGIMKKIHKKIVI